MASNTSLIRYAPQQTGMAFIYSMLTEGKEKGSIKIEELSKSSVFVQALLWKEEQNPIELQKLTGLKTLKIKHERLGGLLSSTRLTPIVIKPTSLVEQVLEGVEELFGATFDATTKDKKNQPSGISFMDISVSHPERRPIENLKIAGTIKQMAALLLDVLTKKKDVGPKIHTEGFYCRPPQPNVAMGDDLKRIKSAFNTKVSESKWINSKESELFLEKSLKNLGNAGKETVDTMILILKKKSLLIAYNGDKNLFKVVDSSELTRESIEELLNGWRYHVYVPNVLEERDSDGSILIKLKAMKNDHYDRLNTYNNGPHTRLYRYLNEK